ncbi:GAF domain-containing protein [Oceanospirillum sediminis]|uniref:GAF domain-containing protein n=1 Tax=Oceanospirillum sediminis TaxID=2760088 RepID=A0A839IQK6_9GAMM|nr:GAF domain-containing protein [Oceanospirillum sediminis]MBB1486779.1 GAF domain-containing protein [Oceanospirillum sediminis]
MAENLIIDKSKSRKDRYEELLPQIESLISYEDNLIANLANVAASLKQTFDFFWVGFYITEDQETLVLGPFQGPIACTRIPSGKGVCGTAMAKACTLLVPDVDQFPGHIACSSDSKSEIVVPGFKDNKVVLILDIDSDKVEDFDETDQVALETLMRIIEARL